MHAQNTSSIDNGPNDVDHPSEIVDNLESLDLPIIIKETAPRQIVRCSEDSSSVFKKELSLLLTKIPQKYGHQFVKLITRHRCFNHLPKDVRTYIHTPRTPTSTSLVAGGEYLHLGFGQALKRILILVPKDKIPSPVEVDFNTDGACYDKENKIHLWPIQIRAANVPNSIVEFVGVWLGQSITKPTNFVQFLKPFVNDVLSVLKNGVEVESGKRMTVKLRCFIADAPARSYVLGHFAHNSKVPCSKCKVIGVHLREGVTVYRGDSWDPRTDKEYASRIDGSHHSETGVLWLSYHSVWSRMSYLSICISVVWV